MGSGDANNVREWLVQSGLRHHTAAFASVSEEAFKGLIMQVKATCKKGCLESWSMRYSCSICIYTLCMYTMPKRIFKRPVCSSRFNAVGGPASCFL